MTIMERKIATYSEKNVRLQLVKVEDNLYNMIEMRYNRKMINHWPLFCSREARLAFISAVHEILVKRSSDMSHLT